MKNLILHRFSEFKQVSILTVLSIFLLALRMKITHDFFLLFLVWNLFLAYIPYMMVVRLRFRESVSTTNIILTGIVWLAFLPNAPYIITDLIHVRHASSEWIVYEALMIASFAITGIYLGLLSLRDMSLVLQNKGWITKVTYRRIFEYGILSLCGYGIYLGRVLRWNSWDILQHPEKLFYDMIDLFIHPFSNQSAWLLITCMSLFLCVIFNIFKKHTFATTTPS